VARSSSLHSLVVPHLDGCLSPGTTLSFQVSVQFHALFTNLFYFAVFRRSGSCRRHALCHGSSTKYRFLMRNIPGVLRFVRVVRMLVLSTHLCHRHVESTKPIQLSITANIWLYLLTDLELISGIGMLVRSGCFHQIQFAPGLDCSRLRCPTNSLNYILTSLGLF